jgi:hypothetical protein
MLTYAGMAEENLKLKALVDDFIRMSSELEVLRSEETKRYTSILVCLKAS